MFIAQVFDSIVRYCQRVTEGSCGPLLHFGGTPWTIYG